MSTAETAQSLPVPVVKRPAVLKFSRAATPIVPPGSVTGRSLTLVVAIMGFLASLTAGGVYLVFQAATVWTNNIAAEVTIQVQQKAGEAIDGKLGEIKNFLTAQNGIKRVVPYSREQSLKLVEPWIGRSDILRSFAIPRLIAVQVDRANPPELPTLKKVLEAKFPGVILDDHGLWRSEIRRLTHLLELGGIGMLILMAAATAAVIVAAATSALASNREIVAVLNFVGAEEKFIARQFETHFMKVGIKAGVLGAGVAGVFFGIMPYATAGMSGAASSAAEIERLVSAGTLDAGGYIILLLVVVAVSGICKLTSRYGVRRILNQQNA